MGQPKVSIVIVTINRKKDLIECIDSLKQVTYKNMEVIVVDNASKDGSAEAVRQTHPWVKVVESGENLGFAKGNNLGSKMALEGGADYILWLNDDVVVDPGFLEPMVELGESDPVIGAVGPKVYYHYDPDLLWATGDQEGIRMKDEGQFDKVREISWVIGCAFLVKKTVIDKIGLLDEDFFLYAEEDEYCHRITKGGYKMFYAPKAKIWHKVAPGDCNLKKYQVYYNARNGIIVRCKKYSGFRAIASMGNYIVRGAPGYAKVLLRNGKKRELWYIAVGVKDGLLWWARLKPAGRNDKIKLV